MTDIVIAGGARTPIGRFNGGLSSLPPTKLGEIAVREALQRAKVGIPFTHVAPSAGAGSLVAMI